jgi:hypothetical protein
MEGYKRFSPGHGWFLTIFNRLLHSFIQSMGQNEIFHHSNISSFNLIEERVFNDFSIFELYYGLSERVTRQELKSNKKDAFYFLVHK